MKTLAEQLKQIPAQPEEMDAEGRQKYQKAMKSLYDLQAQAAAAGGVTSLLVLFDVSLLVT